MTSGFCIGQCRYRHVVEGKTEVVSFSCLPCRVRDMFTCLRIYYTRVSSKYSSLFVVSEHEFVCILL